MIIVTGGAGFIGSALVWHLNQAGVSDILIADDLAPEKDANLRGRSYTDYIHKDECLRRVKDNAFDRPVKAILHMGACTSTTEMDVLYLQENNVTYSQTLIEYALAHGVRMIYASSAATYGSGDEGYDDAHELVPRLKPLNPYGQSKQDVDLWALQEGLLDRVAGLKFFNVFGPNEYHKGDMASMLFKAFHQIRDQGFVRLFRSHHKAYSDGEQKRDFVYVKDCVSVVGWLLEHPEVNGLYNVGTGRARTWNELVAAIFSALGKAPEIEYIDMPEELREQYQYFTEARMDKLRTAGYTPPFTSLENAAADYVQNYLSKTDPHL